MALQRTTKLGHTRLYSSSVVISDTEEIVFDWDSSILSFCKRKHDFERATGIMRKIQIWILYLSDTGAVSNHTLTSIFSPSRRNCIQRLIVSLLQAASKKPVLLERFLLLHVYTADQSTGMVWRCKQIRLSNTCRDFFHEFLCAWYISFLTKNDIRTLGNCLNQRGKSQEQEEISVVASYLLTEKESPKQYKIHDAWQASLTPKIKSPVIFRVHIVVRRTIHKSKAPHERKISSPVCRSVATIPSLVPIHILPTKFSNKPVHLAKEMVIAHGVHYRSL